MTTAPARIGVDLGGTKIEAVALGPSGEELARRRVPTPVEDYRALLAAVVELVEGMSVAGAPVAEAVGVGAPGALSPTTGLVKNSNSTALNGRPLDRDLEMALGRPVILANDADCFTLSEAVDGAGRGARAVFGVILGTGVGGGVAVGGRALVGPNRVTGEWGHNPLPWPEDGERPGPECYCGRRGCIETWLSGPGLAADHRRGGGRSMTAPEIVAAAEKGDGPAAATFGRYLDRLARSLATVINALDPDVVVVGGGMSNVDVLYAEVPDRWSSYVFGGEVATRLLRNHHGDSSGVRGAASLVGGIMHR